MLELADANKEDGTESEVHKEECGNAPGSAAQHEEEDLGTNEERKEESGERMKGMRRDIKKVIGDMGTQVK